MDEDGKVEEENLLGSSHEAKHGVGIGLGVSTIVIVIIRGEE